MQASPYDLTEFSFEAIRLETVPGRRMYAQQQAALATTAEPLRNRLMRSLTDLRFASNSPVT